MNLNRDTRQQFVVVQIHPSSYRTDVRCPKGGVACESANQLFEPSRKWWNWSFCRFIIWSRNTRWDGVVSFVWWTHGSSLFHLHWRLQQSAIKTPQMQLTSQHFLFFLFLSLNFDSNKELNKGRKWPQFYFFLKYLYILLPKLIISCQLIEQLIISNICLLYIK